MSYPAFTPTHLRKLALPFAFLASTLIAQPALAEPRIASPEVLNQRLSRDFQRQLEQIRESANIRSLSDALHIPEGFSLDNPKWEPLMGASDPIRGFGGNGEDQMPGSDPVPDPTRDPETNPGPPSTTGSPPAVGSITFAAAASDDNKPLYGTRFNQLEVDASGLTKAERQKLEQFVKDELNRSVVFTP